MAQDKGSITLLGDFDIVAARQRARELARDIGFGLTDQARIATAVSEVARQILANEDEGLMSFAIVIDSGRRGLECVAQSCQWLETPIFPRGEILGGVERLMDEFKLKPHQGDTVVVMRKWLNP